jgi:excisionase family DNA binding protein
MGRRRNEEGRLYGDEARGPIPHDPVNLLAGIGPGLELAADDLPAGVAGNERASEAFLTVEELGRMLRVGETTIRRLIRTAVIRPVLVDGSPRIPRSQVEAYRAGLHRSSPDKPGE